jgi:molybdate transport system regulatory protein
MKQAAAASGRPELKPRFRIVSGTEIALGPGKVELLTLVEKTGSIRQAAVRLDMSYMRAWSLVRTMNRCFRTPLVRSVRGGGKGGGAELTPAGKKVLVLYLEMESEALPATTPAWTRLRRQVKKSAR